MLVLSKLAITCGLVHLARIDAYAAEDWCDDAESERLHQLADDIAEQMSAEDYARGIEEFRGGLL